MIVTEATDQQSWDAFLLKQQFHPFLQSWTMGEVYRAIGQTPVRLQVEDGNDITAICFAHVVPARRGRHLSIPYGPVLSDDAALEPLLKALDAAAKKHKCSFIRLSPFWLKESKAEKSLETKSMSSPLHLLAEHLWYLPLQKKDPWSGQSSEVDITEESLFANLRATHRNLIRRAQKEGVTVEASKDPVADMHYFLTLHDETRKRHKFTPYSNKFFQAQVELFAAQKAATLYLARYQGEVIAASVHMHFGKETSYHHGASTHKYAKIPASYLLQWTAICDALKRGDHVYNFWGIAPPDPAAEDPLKAAAHSKHPFAGVTLFKTGFHGNLLELTHCRDIKVSPSYYLTRAFEYARKWKRGF
jgi:lipid II:glycine glycyltransferase (peptidoglycan interpeptide bridge formation enzyme)